MLPANPDAFKALILAKHPNGVAADGRRYADIPAQELTQKIVAKFPDGQTNDGRKYKDFLNVSPETTVPTFKAGGVIGGIQDVAQGFAKGGYSTILGLGGIGNKIQQGVAGVARFLGANVAPSAAGKESIFNPQSETGQVAQQAVTPTGTAENIGYGAEKFAEFFIPASKAAKAEKAVDLLSKGIKESPKLAATARIVGKGLVQGGAAGAVTAAQTGGDVSKTAQSALTAGVLRSGIATIGEGARALRIPERLYSTIFKNSKQDMFAELKEGGLKTLQEKKPEKYAEWVKNGLIKTGADGAPILNETLAERALDKGLRGSIRTMADTVVEGTIQSEDDVQRVVSTYKGSVGLGEPQFHRVLKQIAEEYQDVGFGEISERATALADDIIASKGKVSGKTALEIRRLLDRARISRSFDVPTSKLSLSQANLKTLADTVRQRVNKIPELAGVMDEYSFYIDAMEALASEAKRRGNNQVLGLIDTVFLGGGLASGATPQGAIMALVAKYLRSGQGTTGLAQILNKGVVSPGVGAAIGATSDLTTTVANSQ